MGKRTRKRKKAVTPEISAAIDAAVDERSRVAVAVSELTTLDMVTNHGTLVPMVQALYRHFG